MRLFRYFLAFAIICTPLHAEFDHSHALFTEVLKKYVSGKNVDYTSLHKSPDKLGAYLVTLKAVPKTEFDGWNEKQQIAFLINLYNAATLKLIVDYYPVKSIRDIDDPWDQKRVKVFGEAISLDHVEHGILRKEYNEPRIHFGVNCASVGCPPLRAEAFRAEVLDKQLDEQTRAFLSDSSNNRVDLKTRTLYLSPIFDWYGEDFVKASGTLQKFVAPYFKESVRKTLETESFEIEYTDYSWTLNQA
jgi:hypothetical protein